MPHFIAKKIDFKPFPFIDSEYEFLGEYFSEKNPKESLIEVKYLNYHFFIKKIIRKNDILIKAEKITKPNPIGILKQALRILSKQSLVILHNLNNDKIRQISNSPFYIGAENISKLVLKNYNIEVGFGSGRHLLKVAQEYPLKLHIGLEIHTPSIEQVIRQIELLNLKNLYILNMDTRIFLEMLPSNQCENIFIHFPVPWNKKPHRRVLSEKFLLEALRVLKKNGVLDFRTDDEIYFEDVLKLGLKNSQISMQVNKNIDTNIVSKYEARWLKQEKNIFDIKIFSQEDNKDKKIEYDFKIDFFCGNLNNTKIIQKDIFLHIWDIFISKEKILVGVSMGDFDWPINKIIVLDKKTQEAYYFNSPPFLTQGNIKAHEELLKLWKAK